MCTRFLIEPDSEELQEIIEEALKSNLNRIFIRENKYLLKEGEVRPTDVVPVIAPDRKGNRGVFPMRWGFQFPKGPLLVNARAETAAQKPAFRESWIRRRCIVPASCYFEWSHFVDEAGKKRTGDKYAIRPENDSLTWLCGLYRIVDGLPEFTILTREPGEAVSKIHDRMPLILPKDKIDAWIGPESHPEEVMKEALTDMKLYKTSLIH